MQGMHLAVVGCGHEVWRWAKCPWRMRLYIGGRMRKASNTGPSFG